MTKNIVLYRKELEKIKGVKIEKVEIHEVNLNTFFIVDKNKFFLYLNRGEVIQELPYESHKNAFQGKLKEIELVKVKTDNGMFSFYNDVDKLRVCLREVVLEKDSIPIDLEKMPFLRESFLSYKGYDIEWTGENYQASDYFTKKIVSLGTDSEEVFSDVDRFIVWKNKISINPEYYKEKGIEIKIVSSGDRYPTFPYTFEIDVKNGEKIKGFGISNVFETSEEATLKACFVSNELMQK